VDRAMTSDECQAIRLELGAYVLGALDAAERDQVAAHLERCADCSRELARLAPLPGLLARVPGPQLADAADDEPQGAERLLAELARIRKRRRRVVAAIAMACVVAVFGGFGLTRTLGPSAAHPTVISAASASTHVSGRIALVATPEGSRLEIGLTGVRPGTRCWLVVVGSGGRREVAATWRASYDGRAAVTGASAMTPAQITRMMVVAQTGEALLVLPGTAGAGAS
jgi:hypothetical protein